MPVWEFGGLEVWFFVFFFWEEGVWGRERGGFGGLWIFLGGEEERFEGFRGFGVQVLEFYVLG